MTFFAVLIAILAGAANPFQSGTNAELNKQLGTPLWAAIVVYGTGLVGVLVCELLLRQRLPAGGRVGSVPVWAWMGGLISILPTLAGLTLAQRLGAGIFTGITVTVSLATSIALDHFGLIGFREHAASPLRLAGCAIMVAGLWMIARS
jgi:bacterial/archaeal transporter family-2 protein